MGQNRAARSPRHGASPRFPAVCRSRHCSRPSRPALDRSCLTCFVGLEQRGTSRTERLERLRLMGEDRVVVGLLVPDMPALALAAFIVRALAEDVALADRAFAFALQPVEVVGDFVPTVGTLVLACGDPLQVL